MLGEFPEYQTASQSNFSPCKFSSLRYFITVMENWWTHLAWVILCTSSESPAQKQNPKRLTSTSSKKWNPPPCLKRHVQENTRMLARILLCSAPCKTRDHSRTLPSTITLLFCGLQTTAVHCRALVQQELTGWPVALRAHGAITWCHMWGWDTNYHKFVRTFCSTWFLFCFPSAVKHSEFFFILPHSCSLGLLTCRYKKA